jgi:glycine/D-amino acid oxidase-like deaminating enzyme
MAHAIRDDAMDLVSGHAVWLRGDRHVAPPAPTVPRDLRCDVVVLGAGITGALVADRLASTGRSVIVVDRRWRAHGSTSASTALIQWEIDTPLVELTKQIGERDAMRAYRSSHRGVAEFMQLVASLDVPVGYAPRPTLYVASTAKDARSLPEEAARRHAAGLEAELVDRERLVGMYGIDRPAAIRSSESATVDPVRLTEALLARAETHGATVYEGTAIDDVETTASGIVVKTATGPMLRAGHLVLASGYESTRYLSERVASLKSTYAFASRPIEPDRLWAEEALLWETARPYLYARTTPDHRIIVGGADDDFRDPERRARKLDARIRDVSAGIRDLIPGLAFEIETTWAGTFSETEDGLPYIGPSPERPNASFALGYGGNGITFSVLAAEIIASQLAGEQHPDEDLYRFGR